VLVFGHRPPITAAHRAICRRSLDFELAWRERNNSYMRLTALVLFGISDIARSRPLVMATFEVSTEPTESGSLMRKWSRHTSRE
jgi:hypothetical protein